MDASDWCCLGFVLAIASLIAVAVVRFVQRLAAYPEFLEDEDDV